MVNNSARSLKRIAFDTWSLHRRFINHGIHVYARELLIAFGQMARERGLEITPFQSPGFDSVADALPQRAGLKQQQTSLLESDRLWRYGGSAIAAVRSRADVLFNPGGTAVAMKQLVPTVSTIHDLTPVVMPSNTRRTTFFLTLLLRAASKGSTAIVVDSQCSKRDLVSLWKVPDARVHVVYLGYDKQIFNTSPADPQAQQDLLTRCGIHQPYIVHHGAVQPRKNLKRLIEAYGLMRSHHRDLDCDLVLAGPLAWSHEETLAAAKIVQQAAGRVVFTGALSDAELSLVIKGASLEVIPSLYEGFCLPMVEAMASGVPTIAAKTSCLPEVSGGVLRYFDPESVEEMAACMEEALMDEGLRRSLVQHGTTRAAIFDWRRCAQETLDVLEKVARAKDSVA